MMSETQIEVLVQELLLCLKQNQATLSEMHRMITNDTDHWIDHDLTFILNYLETYLRDHHTLLHSRRKPRGKILIILSYNEPFVLSIVPILNALITNNQVHVRPSSKASRFFAEIWFASGICERLGLSLHLEQRELSALYEELDDFTSVYFFGSHQHATELAAACGERYVSFHPEVEGVDTKVLLPEQLPHWSIIDDARATLWQAMSHAGQSCQRLHGVFVPQAQKGDYVNALQELLQDSLFLEQHIRKDHSVPAEQRTHLEKMITAAKPQTVHRAKADLPVVIDSPDPVSELVYAAFFMPTLWVIGYTDMDEILTQLSARRYRLGLNLIGSNVAQIEECIEKTSFSRYTVNTSHIEIRSGEGWGGLSPTGFHGYQSWIEHFSYPVTVIS